MELKIFDKQGIVKMTVSPDNSSQWNHEVGVENVVTVNFTTWEFLVLEVGWYILVEGHRFSIKSEYRPKHIHNNKYTYNLKFYGREHDTQDILFCRLNQGEDDLESVFAYDGTPMDFLNKVVANMNRNSDGVVWKAGEAITANRQTINFNGLYCWDALGEITRTFGTEWWMDGEYVNLSKCIRGESVSLGYGEGLKSGLTQNENTNAVKWFTRLIPVGSTKNIDKNKYGYANLQLPGREKYIDINTQYGLKEYREEAAFSEIYPHRVGTISSVRSEEHTNEETGNYTVFYVKDSSLPFNPDDYMIGGEVIHMSFNTGALAGKEFEVNWNNDTKEFEIINQYPDENTQLPGRNLIPSVGDTYVLSNISMPDEYNTAAEKEYKEAVDAYLAEYSKDVSIYSGNTDYIYVTKNNVPLLLGQRVRLISEQYFDEGSRESRITRVSRKLNNLGEASIDCSDAIGYSWVSKIQSSVNSTIINQVNLQGKTEAIEKEVSSLSESSKFWELRESQNGFKYLFSNLPVATKYGITMYADGGDLNLPQLYAGLPIDGRTLIRDDNGVLMINPDIDLGGGLTEVYWNDIKAKPTFATVATSGKYADLSGLPDLSVYALAKDLAKYVTLNTEQTIAAHKNFLDGLSVGGLGITKSQDDVIYLDANLVVRGGITMYATDTVDVPSIIDSLPIASTSAKGLASFDPNFFSVDDNGNVSFIGSTGGVDESLLADYAKKDDLSAYLPLSGGQMTGGISCPIEYDGNITGLAASCVFYYNNSLTARNSIDNKRSLMGCGKNKTTGSWYNIISVRGDSSNYGMYLASSMNFNNQENLSWNRQIGSNGDWQGERVILDSYNWSQYVTAGDGGNYLPLSGGTITNSGTGLYINRTTAGANPHITFEVNGSRIGGLGIASHGEPAFYSYGMTGSTGWKRILYDGASAFSLSNITIYQDKWANGIMLKRQVANGGAGISSYNYDTLLGTFGVNGSKYFEFSNNLNSIVFTVSSNGDGLFYGGITMYSDIRKKTKLQDVELTLQQIADAPLIEHYYNSDAMRTTHVGSIAQYWAGLNDWFCKKDSEGFYTMEIQNAALASAISIARELVKYESKTDRTIRKLKKRISELEDEIEKLKSA